MKSVVKKKSGERSFTIIEVMVAIGIMMSVVLEVTGAQGNIVSFSTYSRRLSEATWLAKRVMSQVEYHHSNKELKDLDIKLEDQAFDDLKDSETYASEYTYSLNIEEWKLPIFEILANGGPKKKEGEDSSDDAQGGSSKGSSLAGFEDAVKQIFDGHILKLAKVEVFWPEGARRNSVTLTYLLTNQKAIDTYLLAKSNVYDKLIAAIQKDLDQNK